MRSSVPPLGRLLDLLGLLLFLGGAVCYGWSWIGLEELRALPPVGDHPREFAAIARFTELWKLSRIGMGLMLAGAAVAVGAALHTFLLRRSDNSSLS